MRRSVSKRLAAGRLIIKKLIPVLLAVILAAGAIAGNNASGKLENCKAGGSVNGTVQTEGNLNTLVQGSVSQGTATGTTLAQ